MPLCTHPDLPGQTAELINPDAHPGWEPIDAPDEPASTTPTPEPRTRAAKPKE